MLLKVTTVIVALYVPRIGCQGLNILPGFEPLHNYLYSGPKFWHAL